MKILIMGAGSPHNDYTGVDGLSNFRIPFSYRLHRHFEANRKRLQLYWANLNEPHMNPSRQNSVLAGMGYDNIKHLFVKQMMAIPLSLFDCKDEDFDLIIVELRPKTESLRYPFAEQSRRIQDIIQWHFRNNPDCEIILWDMDEWADLWIPEIEQGAKLAYNYENLNPSVSDISGDTRKIPLYSWRLDEFDKELQIVDNAIEPHFDLMYCGNVYGRERSAMYLDEIGIKYRTYITGNWVRRRNHETVRILDRITFIGQSNHWLTIPLMHQSRASIILGNDKHIHSGLIACRVFEAAIAGTPMIVDKSYDNFSSAFEKYPNRLKFSSGRELQEILETFDDHSTWERARHQTKVFAGSQGRWNWDIKFLLGKHA